ncbi:hypothetical protein HDU98_004290 [Podochytrium sp. JEL0797]|nr:hypothetical protein HDU98_004290 [Podochytrium sp. JEL0797]
MAPFHFLAKAATEQNVIIAGAVFFFSYSILKRTNAAFFPEERALAFAPDFSLVFGYSADQVLANDELNPLFLALATLVNLISISSFSFLGSSVISWAVESVGKAGENFLVVNQLPVVNGVQHMVEAVLFTAAILTSNSEFARLAGMLSQMRSIIAIGSLIITSVAAVQFLGVWFKSIGRDGRQKIEKKE